VLLIKISGSAISAMRWYFGFFFVSGFCSLLYEIVWVRLAMAQFGVTTALVSIVLSAFMVGLGIGSWGSGILARRYEGRIRFPALRLYAVTEMLIGLSAIVVPYELSAGRALIQHDVSPMALAASGYYLSSGLWIAITLIPWCACMGATFPFAMLALKSSSSFTSGRSFSYLYVANVLGAVCGAILPLFLIELLGFHHTLYVGAALNFMLATCVFVLSASRTSSKEQTSRKIVSQSDVRQAAASNIETPRIGMVPNGGTNPAKRANGKKLLWLLAGTGITSMGAEIVWIRIYTPPLGTVVYAFASILAAYLGATYLGSWAYQRKGKGVSIDDSLLWILLGFSIVLPIVSVDPRLPLFALQRLFFGVLPFSSIVGFLTPMIVDLYSAGDPDRAGRAYAVNIAGCVLGPLISGFVLLPWIGERASLCLFAIPWFGMGLFLAPRTLRNSLSKVATAGMLFLCAVAIASFAVGYEDQYTPRIVRRDNTATVVASGTGFGRRLLINGVGITALTPITKMMVHLPLAFMQRPPTNALVICFGMGTSFRSALSWHISTTVAELVPSVPPLFSFFHADVPNLDKSLERVVIDDGRSFLERSQEQYDVIAIDPPPPVEAAGSSLLYSKEFYSIARSHLRAGGILQQWMPDGDNETWASMAKALQESFPCVRAFHWPGNSGIHFLASMTPIPQESAAQLVAHMPATAAKDLIEWGPSSSAEQQFKSVLDAEVPMASLIQKNPGAPVLADDRPVNEYFLLRRLSEPQFIKTVKHQLFNRKEAF
jgi:spermidine synthase